MSATMGRQKLTIVSDSDDITIRYTEKWKVLHRDTARGIHERCFRMLATAIADYKASGCPDSFGVNEDVGFHYQFYFTSKK